MARCRGAGEDEGDDVGTHQAILDDGVGDEVGDPDCSRPTHGGHQQCDQEWQRPLTVLAGCEQDCQSRERHVDAFFDGFGQLSLRRPSACLGV